jgi:hypothetical protein
MTKVWRVHCHTTHSDTLYPSDEHPAACPIDGCANFDCVLDSVTDE